MEATQKRPRGGIFRCLTESLDGVQGVVSPPDEMILARNAREIESNIAVGTHSYDGVRELPVS